MTVATKLIDQQMYLDPFNNRWQYDAKNHTFIKREEGSIGHCQDTDTEFIAALRIETEGDRLSREVIGARKGRVPGVKELKQLFAKAEEVAELLPDGRKPVVFVAFKLIDLGGRIDWKDEKTSTVSMVTMSWDMYDYIWGELQAIGRGPNHEQDMVEFHKDLGCNENTGASKEYVQRYEAIFDREINNGMSASDLLSIWGTTYGGNGKDPDFGEERLIRYAEAINAFKTKPQDVPPAGAAPVMETMSEVDERAEAAKLVGEENVEWFMNQDPEYQSYLRALSPEDLQDELEETQPKKETSTESASGAEPSVVIMPPASTALSASESSIGTEPPQLPAHPSDLVKTVEGYIVDADGVILNKEQAMELAGVTDGFAIETWDDLQIFVGRMNDLQSRFERRCGMFIRSTLPLVTAHRRLMEEYTPQLLEFGKKNLPTWDSDSRPGVKDPHKRGDLKKKSLKCDEGIVYYRTTGGWKVEHEKDIKDVILRDMNLLDINQLLPAEIRETYGARLELSFSKKKVYALADAGKRLPGLGKVPENPIGKVGIGNEKSRSMWTPEKLAKVVRSTLKQLVAQFKGIEYKPDSDEDEGEDE